MVKHGWIWNERCLTPTKLCSSVQASVHPSHPAGLLQHVQVCSMKVQMMGGWSLGCKKSPGRGIYIGGGVNVDSSIHGGGRIKRYGLHGQNSHFISVYFWRLNKLLTTSLGVGCRRCFENPFLHQLCSASYLVQSSFQDAQDQQQYHIETQLYLQIAERGKKWGKCQNNDWSLFDDERRECANTL